MTNQLKKNLGFSVGLACIFFFGAYLRLHSLSSQILLDDEWHNIIRVIQSNYVDVLTRFNPHDNSSPPLALYNLGLYDTFGWNEFTLRLPVIVSGMLSLIILPMFVRKLFDNRVSLVFAGSLAIAPFLIFYSRFARAYGITMLLCFLGILLFYQWLTTGRTSHAVGFVLSGILAIYTHPSALIAIFTPLSIALASLAVHNTKPGASISRQIVVPLKSVLIVAAILIIPLVPLMSPMLSESGALPWHMGSFTLNGIITAASLMSGTANWPLSVLFFLLCILGEWQLIRQNALMGWIFFFIAFAYLLLLLVSGPIGLDVGAVLLRYMIVAVPLSLTLVAIALDGLVKRFQAVRQVHPILPNLAVVAFVGTFFVAGPLPVIDASPNNFLDHSAFHGSYVPHTWERSVAIGVYPPYTIGKDQVAPFYRSLGEQFEIKAVIEYPFDICDYNDLFYYYQHFDKKRILAGYCTDPALIGYSVPQSSDQESFTVGMLTVDDILSRVSDRSKLHFSNMVDVSDSVNLLTNRADVIILHKYIMALKIVPNDVDPVRTYGRIRVDYQSVPLLRTRFEKAFGPPTYEDEQIVCFKIK